MERAYEEISKLQKKWQITSGMLNFNQFQLNKISVQYYNYVVKWLIIAQRCYRRKKWIFVLQIMIAVNFDHVHVYSFICGAVRHMMFVFELVHYISESCDINCGEAILLQLELY